MEEGGVGTRGSGELGETLEEADSRHGKIMLPSNHHYLVLTLVSRSTTYLRNSMDMHLCVIRRPAQRYG